MNLHFYKYQGAGNDFILLDARNNDYTWKTNDALIQKLCNRRFGIGADGLMLLKDNNSFDFEMIYYNADGNLGSMCGNGGRCITAFARDLTIITHKTTFIASDGPHHAQIDKHWVSLGMIDVNQVKNLDDNTFLLNTGSPHYVRFVNELHLIDVFKDGKAIRYSKAYAPNGINVNFIEATDAFLKIRTYERGVENETFACGTGATAAAMAYAYKNQHFGNNEIALQAPGGDLNVSFNFEPNIGFKNVYLSGPAQKVFEGNIQI